MIKRFAWGLAVIAVLCALAPWASQAPDAIQKVLGLPGGAGTGMKAAEGVVVTVAVVLFLGQVFKYLKRPPS